MPNFINWFLLLICCPILLAQNIPKIVKTNLPQAQKEGSYFNVLCSVHEGSLPLFFEWSKNGQVISNKNDVAKISSFNERSSALIIEKVNSSDDGNYTCNARNVYGSDDHVFTLIVKGNNS